MSRETAASPCAPRTRWAMTSCRASTTTSTRARRRSATARSSPIRRGGLTIRMAAKIRTRLSPDPTRSTSRLAPSARWTPASTRRGCSSGTRPSSSSWGGAGVSRPPISGATRTGCGRRPRSTRGFSWVPGRAPSRACRTPSAPRMRI